jgi:hypothetical protein
LIWTFMIGYLTVCLCGCEGKKAETGEAKAKEPGVVEYMTGAEDLKQYQKVRSKIEDINRSQEEQRKEAGL